MQGAARTSFVERRHGSTDHTIDIDSADAVQRMVARFIAFARGECEASLPLRESVRTMAVVDALRQSAREGRAVDVEL